jgi:hypothetical protein
VLTMPKQSSKELFLACLSNPSVVRSRFEPRIDEARSGHVIVELKVPSSRPIRTNSGQSTSLTESLNSSSSSIDYDEAVRILLNSPQKDPSQEQEAVAESVTCPDSSRLLSPSKSSHRSISPANLKTPPKRTLGQGRRNSSRSINKNSPPQAHSEEQPVSRSPHVLLKSSRSPRKARQGVGSVLTSQHRQMESLSKSAHRSTSAILPLKSGAILDSVLMVPYDFDLASVSSVSSSDASSVDMSRKSRPQLIRSPSKTLNGPGLAGDRWSSSRCIRHSLDDDDDDDDDDVSIEIGVAPPRSPRRSFTRNPSEAGTIELMSRSVSSLNHAGPPPLLDAAIQGNPTEMPKDCPPQVGPAASRSLHKRLNEKAASVHLLFKSPGASNRKSQSKGITRSTSAADLNPMASTLPQRTLPSESLADSRWDSSRSLLDSAPTVPAVEDAPIEISSDDDDYVSIEIDGADDVSSGIDATQSPRRSFTKKTLQPKLNAVMSQSVSNMNYTSPSPLLDAPFQGNPTEMATVCPPQIVPAAPRSPRKCLNEKASSVHCLFKSSLASNRKSPTRGLSRSTSAADLNPMASTLPQRTLLADSRWDSSRSLLDSAPKVPAAEDAPIDTSIDDDDDDVSIKIDVAPPQSPRKSFTRKPSQSTLNAMINQSASNMIYTGPSLLLDAPSQDNPTEIPTDCPPKVVAAAPRSPRKCLNEKALSVHCMFKSSGVSNRKSPSRGLSRSTSAADLNPMASTLSQRMLPSESLADSRWDSSRSLLDSAPKAPVDENNPIAISLEGAQLSPRSQQKIFARLILSALAFKTAEANPLSTESSPVADTKALPPTTLCRASLAEARWDSSRSLNDCPPKLPKEDDNSNALSPNFEDMAPRSPRKTTEVNPPSAASSQPAPVADTKALPPTTLCRASLAEARWDSSRSLTDCNVEDKAPRSPRKTPQANTTTKVSSQPAPVADTKALPPTTFCRASLAEARWDSSQSLNDGNVEDKAPRSPRKAPQVNEPSKASSQPASTSADKVLPPKTLPSVSLADTRWDSSRSLTDCPPKAPGDENTLSEIEPMTPRSPRKTLSKKAASARLLKTSGMSPTKSPSRTLAKANSVVTRNAPPATLAETKRDSLRSLTDHAAKTPKSPRKKKQKDSHLRSLLGIKRDAPDNKSIASAPAPSVYKNPSPSIQTMSRQDDESSGVGKRRNRACPRRQLSMLKSASAASSQKNDEHTLKDVLDEYAKIIDDFKKAAY